MLTYLRSYRSFLCPGPLACWLNQRKQRAGQSLDRHRKTGQPEPTTYLFPATTSSDQRPSSKSDHVVLRYRVDTMLHDGIYRPAQATASISHPAAELGMYFFSRNYYCKCTLDLFCFYSSLMKNTQQTAYLDKHHRYHFHRVDAVAWARVDDGV